MNTNKLLSVIALGAISLAGAAYAGEIDIIDASDAQAGTYFVPTDAQKYDSPYYRPYYQDWGWTHNALTAPFTTAELNVSAFDVDYAGIPGYVGERDEIFAYDTDTATWLSLGFLDGSDNIWEFTTFALSSTLFNEVALGLQVKIDIDTLAEGWIVTLAKSTLTTDGTPAGNPTPGVPDSGATALLLGLGLVAMQLVRRQRA